MYTNIRRIEGEITRANSWTASIGIGMTLGITFKQILANLSKCQREIERKYEERKGNLLFHSYAIYAQFYIWHLLKFAII